MRIITNLPLGSNFFFHDADFILREIVEIVSEVVDPAIRGVDLALEVRLFVVRPGSGQSPVEGEHLFDQGKRKLITD
jgi:hypothetical protein